MEKTVFKDTFYGKPISEYGLANGFVDYATFASVIPHILNLNIIAETDGIVGYWEREDDFDYGNLEWKIDELKGEISECEEAIEEFENEDDEEIQNLEKHISELQDQIDELEYRLDREIFQYFIVTDSGASLIKEYLDDPLFYNSELDMYVWGITHWGTSWDYVLTDIPCEKIEKKGN